MSFNFELFAFYANPEKLTELIASEIDGIVIDWERKGKELRQGLYNTQISEHHMEHLQLVKARNPRQIICRINPVNPESETEIELAIDHGADEILIPMVRTVKEVEQVLKFTENRVKVGLMLETEESLKAAIELNDLPVYRFFVGLNDLSIQRGVRNIFTPFMDGTLEELRPKITKHFGVAGLTHPLLGDPIPSKYLFNLMKHYKCSYAFLRRSFYRDLEQFSVSGMLDAMKYEFEKEMEKMAWNEYSYLLSKANVI